MKKETKWFALDCYDDQDPAIIAMCSVYKAEGFGRWMKLLMLLRAEEGYKFDITQLYAYKVLASRLMTTEVKVKAFIADLINTYGLLQTDEHYLWAGLLTERMGRLDKTKAQRRKAGKKSAAQKKKQPETVQQNENFVDPLLQQEVSNTENLLQQNSTHNITQHNKTQQNTTTTKQQKSKNEIEAATIKEGQGTDTKAFGLHTCRQAAMADERRFVYPHITARDITPEQLGHWLDAFNRTLEYRNTQAKSHEDYRTHFANWFKFRNTATEDPLTLSPMPVPPPAAPQQPHLAYLKTPQQAQQEEDLRMRSLLEQLGEDPPPPARKTA